MRPLMTITQESYYLYLSSITYIALRFGDLLESVILFNLV